MRMRIYPIKPRPNDSDSCLVVFGLNGTGLLRSVSSKCVITAHSTKENNLKPHLGKVQLSLSSCRDCWEGVCRRKVLFKVFAHTLGWIPFYGPSES